ncbi:MAG: thiamine ABC transporter ATP-binding protein, partial [Oceanospirillaceae bacterium]|nr:thiamine ABC transporter ATP-binding protein [Oceanospirillaceae bacterium]
MIELKHVRCGIGEQQFHYDLQLPEGEIVAVMGAS